MANVTRDFRPNLYLAIADDWGYATSYTGQNLSTPAFDALVRDGVIFTRAFTANNETFFGCGKAPKGSFSVISDDVDFCD